METFGKWTLEYIALAAMGGTALFGISICLMELKDYLFDKFKK